MKKVLMALVIAVNTSSVFAGFTNGNELYQWLQESENPSGSSFKTGLYSGYIAGVVDTVDGIQFCTTSGVTRGQNSAVVAKYLKNNPEKWSQSADTLVIDAMKQTFPCKK